MSKQTETQTQNQTFESPEFLTNLSGGVMCAMSDGANFGPVTIS